MSLASPTLQEDSSLLCHWWSPRKTQDSRIFEECYYHLLFILVFSKYMVTKRKKYVSAHWPPKILKQDSSLSFRYNKKFLSLSSNHSKNSVCFLCFSWIQIEKGNIYIYIRKFYISAWKNLQNSNLEELKTYREYFILNVFTFESILETVVGEKETMFYCAPAYKWLIMK